MRPLSLEDIEFERRLVPTPRHWGRTGVIKPPFDARDYPADLHPGIAAHLPLALAPIDFLKFVKEPRYDQGNEGSCTCFATSGDCTMDHSEADGSWPQYAGHQLYAEAGGVGNSGTDPRRVLDICVNNGTPLLAGGREKVIKSYVALSTAPGVFRQQVKAANAAGEPCLIYALLPIPFGWHSGTVLSTGYHEFLGIGWMVDDQGEWCIVLNTWGDGWPGDAPPGTPAGVGRILFDTLEQNNGQNGYMGGFVATSLLIAPPVPTPIPTPIPIPVPPPPGGVTVAGRISGTGTGLLAVGQSYRIQAQGLDAALTLTQIQGGPAPVPPPPPPGGLVVQVASGPHHLLSATARDAVGSYLAATCIATTAAGQALGGRQTTPAGATAIPAVWMTTGLPPGTAVTVSATTGGGQTGTGQGTTS